MKCEEALQRLLEAEPRELEGLGPAPVAAHVRSCERCAATASRLVAGHDALVAALDANRPRRTPDEALELTLHARRLDEDATGIRGRPRRQLRRRRVLAVVALPLAVAAALTLILIRGPEPVPPQPLPLALTARRPPPAIDVPAGRGAAVFRTSNPKITVVWIY